eukprot:8523456-Heterocapsa_arctica.AAC.1
MRNSPRAWDWNQLVSDCLASTETLFRRALGSQVSGGAPSNLLTWEPAGRFRETGDTPKEPGDLRAS